MRAKLLTTVIAVLTALSVTTAQHEADQWIIGYWGPSGTDQSVMFLDFRNDKLNIVKLTDLKIQITGTISSVCDNNGAPLFWTNGMQIMKYDGELILDTIDFDGPSGYWDFFYLNNEYQMPFGFPLSEGAIILPAPQHTGQYYIFYHYNEPHPTYIFATSKFLSSKVITSDNKHFSVEFKDSTIGPRIEWYTGKITATRHANGRDWWLITFETNSPNYYSYLLDPNGVQLDHISAIDTSVRMGLGQVKFSNLGNYLVRMDAISTGAGQVITLYGFDRCEGLLSRLATFHTAAGLWSGATFSPSERYLYANDNTHLWQWDLWANDIASSQTLVDTFDGFEQPNWGPMRFGLMVNGPDGRIYIIPNAGSSKFMHVIDRPDLPSQDCNFLQHAINLKIWNGRSAPNLANFRLGPLDDSLCDTLGLNNIPVARWRFDEADLGIPEKIQFIDLSYFDPHMWHWDFDDSSISDEPSPLHTFNPGLYHVCLTVSNSYATDSVCQWVEIFPTDIKGEIVRNTPEISIAPNPFQNQIHINTRNQEFREVEMQLYDVHGRIVLNERELVIPSTIVMSDFAPGIYCCRIEGENGEIWNFNLLKF